MDVKSLLSGMAVGAALAVTLDPARGGRRRAVLRDRLAQYARIASRAAESAMSDLANRAQGFVASRCEQWQSDEVDDVRLVARVRAKLGRACSHPRAIDVEARDGEVALRGPILANEVSDVLAATASVRGVHAVVNALEPHDTTEGVPLLQGTGRFQAPGLDLLPVHWAPATRALVGLAAITASSLAMAAYVRR
jgi:hypothetical protein